MRKRLSFFRVCCKIKVPQDKSNKPISQKIVMSEGAPSLNEEKDENVGEVSPPPKKPNSSMDKFLKRIPQKILSAFSNLPLAIGEMFAIAGLMAIGTAIDQGETPDFYFQKYPEDHPVLGFFTWRWVLTLGFDHMFSSPIFLGTLVLLAASLMACTYTTQIPMVKVARRWNFLKSSEAICKQEFSDKLPRASVQDLGVVLMGAGYEGGYKSIASILERTIFVCFQGLAGRFAPIGVHLAMLLIMVGATLSATGSFRGSVNVPQGLNLLWVMCLVQVDFSRILLKLSIQRSM
ncbi:Cytochrome c biogenesis protein CCS1 chloroplastic [Bienertia sinuspersici]